MLNIPLKLRLLLPLLALPLASCASDNFGYDFDYVDRNVGVYSNVPGNASITIIENRPVPQIYYNNRPYNNPHYNYRPNNKHKHPHHYQQRPNHSHHHPPVFHKNTKKNGYEVQINNDRWDRKGANPRYRPPAQITPGKINRCNRNSC